MKELGNSYSRKENPGIKGGLLCLQGDDKVHKEGGGRDLGGENKWGSEKKKEEEI